ncbi:hypothetical protein [Mycobacterium sp. 1465703.0]|uniref:hypothetical protein n=1 Tax=Mycobacterium sp. 1465703.0 TaxID=1834078 RepID=UPI0009F6EC24|nr:hypothetical protein [Mycobacterium sp. 1465703.0]
MTTDSTLPTPIGDSTGAEDDSQLGYQELDTAARAIASNMQRQAEAGERISARAIGIHRSTTEGQPISAPDAISQSGAALAKKPIPPDRSVWNFVMCTSLGGVDTYLWHRQGSNEFCWRPVGTRWGAEESPTDEPQ